MKSQDFIDWNSSMNPKSQEQKEASFLSEHPGQPESPLLERSVPLPSRLEGLAVVGSRHTC